MNMADEPNPEELPANAVAIVGMAVHAPGALDAATLWKLLAEGRVLTETVSEDELRREGVSEREIRHPRYVRKTLRIPGLAEFEPEFFGFTPRDAAVIDPQLRHLLECSWEALEDAAIDPARPAGPIGLFVGVGVSEYLLSNLLKNQGVVDQHGLDKLLQLGNDRDFIASRIAYALDLRGPCVGIAAACASGALSVHSACQSLLGRECRVALAGAASLQVPHGVGYLYEEGGLSSPDGECRTFDADAQGTVPSSGTAVVTLMRLDDAIAEGRSIYATILATAYNNDGRRKVGYAAPSVEGPLSAIEEALAVAGVDAHSIGYVEAHGTGTPFGDSIEVSALTKAFRQQTDEIGYCVLGANKPNIGHTDAASGVISLIKAAYALKTQTLPPLANFRAPNPLLELPSSPFRVLDERAPWPSDGDPRRALVNCLAVGGTNVEIVLEEPPAEQVLPDAGGAQLLLLSARSADALDASARRLADHLARHPQLRLADVAHTLRAGRHVFSARRALIVTSHEDAIAQLRGEREPAHEAFPELAELAARFIELPSAELHDALSGSEGRYVALPTYPFERRVFWTAPSADEPPQRTAASPLDPEAYLPGVVPHAQVDFLECVPSVAEPRAGQRWLVFADSTGFGEHVVAKLRASDCEIVIVRIGHGPALSRTGQSEYRIDCDRGFEGPTALIAELAREGRLPDIVLHLWPVTTDERFRSATNRFHHDLERGYYTLLALCQALSGLELAKPVRIVAVTNGALRVGDERVSFPAKSLLFGPIATLSLEQSNVSACAIDINVPIGWQRALSIGHRLERAHATAASLLVRESLGRPPGIYAMRGARILTRSFRPVAAPTEASARALPLRHGGTYMILGGFGNLGYAVARELAKRAHVKLALVGRTPIPDRAYWDEWQGSHPDDDPVSLRIGMLRALEDQGAEVLAVSADVCHLESMSSALTLTRRRLGNVRGVIHAAGLLSEALCGSQTLDEARDAMAPEVLGARVLDELLHREKLDFFVMLGNATRFAPRAGTYARLASAEFSDAFCTRTEASHPRVFDLALISDGGMYHRWARTLDAEGPVRDPHALALIAEIERGLPTETAARAIVDALGSDARQLVIGPIPKAGGALTTAIFARSELRREYVAPETEVERKLAALWSEQLRIDRVGATDDFFDLGGHSLIAVRISAKIKATWNVNVPLALMVEAPTVRELGRVITESIRQPGRREHVQLLREWTTIVPLQPHGERPPLFCVGGKGGNVMNLRHLARLLGHDQPVFGLQARGVDGTQKPHESLVEMVDEYVADILRLFPQGPYLLAGFSGGGAMILEMAHRLRARDHAVGPLLFLDAWNPATPERTPAEKVRAHTSLFRELGPRYAALFAQRTVSSRMQKLLHRHTPALADRIWESSGRSGGIVEHAWEAAAAAYQPQPYPGEAVLFRVRANRALGELEFNDDEQNGWGGVVLGGIEVIDVPGTHTSLVEEPHVRTLAQSMRTVLDRTLRGLRAERESGAQSRIA